MKNVILGLLAQTSIHAGAGQQIGFIDQPIQREGHTDWPCVFGSAVKGALRANAEQQKVTMLQQSGKHVIRTKKEYEKLIQESEDITVIYGPHPSSTQGAEHAGALIVSDAKLLLMPVRSLTSQFKWVTCPYALRRYQQDCTRLGIEVPSYSIPKINDSTALVPGNSTTGNLFLGEYRFTAKQEENEQVSSIIKALAQLMDHEDAQSMLENQLVIVSDDNFTHLVKHTTPVNAHVRIDALTKTVEDGALWYEETLPPETLLYVCLSANDSRRDEAIFSAEQIMLIIRDSFAEDQWLQLGGNETVGMGWCGVTTVSEQTSKQKEV